MTLVDVKELIGSFGFPIFITVYMLWERHGIIEALTSRMDKLIVLLEAGNIGCPILKEQQEERERQSEALRR